MHDNNNEDCGWNMAPPEVKGSKCSCPDNKELLRKEVEKKKKELQAICPHENTYVIKEGMTGELGTVYCRDCGYERDWGAY